MISLICEYMFTAVVSTQAQPQIPGGVHITTGTGMEDKQKRSGGCVCMCVCAFMQ